MTGGQGLGPHGTHRRSRRRWGVTRQGRCASTAMGTTLVLLGIRLSVGYAARVPQAAFGPSPRAAASDSLDSGCAGGVTGGGSGISVTAQGRITSWRRDGALASRVILTSQT